MINITQSILFLIIEALNIKYLESRKRKNLLREAQINYAGGQGTFVNGGEGKHCLIIWSFLPNYDSWKNVRANLKLNELKLYNKAKKMFEANER